ncbi:MAG: NAD(P)/FAD-dependent oxidoreductase [Halobacteria archaeon]
MKDLVVVGGGPGGSMAAATATQNGCDVTLIEKGVDREERDCLGADSTDAAGFLDYWLNLVSFEKNDFPVMQDLECAEFITADEKTRFSSDRLGSNLTGVGFTFDRVEMDDMLREKAENEGVEFRVGDRVQNVDSKIDSDGHRHKVELEDETIESRYVVLADGAGRSVTIPAISQFYSAADGIMRGDCNHIGYQEYRRLPDELYEPHVLKFWWGYTPGEMSYVWNFPNKNNICRIGITMPKGSGEDQPSHYVHKVIDEVYGQELPFVEDKGKSLGREACPISSTRPIDSPVDAGIATVGGAMGATSAFHEGGYHLALATGEIAGDLVSKNCLGGYNRAWKNRVGGEIRKNIAMYNMFKDYDRGDWTRLFKTANVTYRRRSPDLYSAYQIPKLWLEYQRELWNEKDFVKIHEYEYSY